MPINKLHDKNKTHKNILTSVTRAHLIKFNQVK